MLNKTHKPPGPTDILSVAYPRHRCPSHQSAAKIAFHPIEKLHRSNSSHKTSRSEANGKPTGNKREVKGKPKHPLNGRFYRRARETTAPRTETRRAIDAKQPSSCPEAADRPSHSSCLVFTSRLAANDAPYLTRQSPVSDSPESGIRPVKVGYPTRRSRISESAESDTRLWILG